MLENPMVSQFEAEELSIPKCEAMIQELEKTLALLENASEKVPAET